MNKFCFAKCPKCDSENITYTDGYIQDEYYCYEAVCDDCDTIFKEWDKLVYIETTWEE